MSVNWSLKKISDICEFQNNKRVPLKSLDREKRQGEYPYYGASGIVDYIDNYIFDGKFLLISEDGENLRTRNTPIAFQAQGRFWVNNHAHILAEKEEGILDYLEYYFSILNINPYITGAVQPKLNKANLDAIEIPIPPVNERLLINQILNSLKEKILLNNQINQTLESIAQAIFKSWFIDFEPVRAKIAAKQEGKDPERAAMCAISGKSEAELEQMAADDFAELQATAALFPDELVESELGEVPKRWKVTNINAVTKSIFSGGTPSTKETAYWNGEIPWLSSGETRNKIIVSTEKSITELAVNKSSTKQAIYGDILIASAGQGHTRGQTSFNGMSCYINQSIVALRANDRISGYWLYYCLEPRYDEMRSLSDSHSSRGSLTTKLLASMPVILPTKELIFSFDKLVKQMFGQQLNNYKEIKTLADMRDALLPKLLSGEIILSKIMEEI